MYLIFLPVFRHSQFTRVSISSLLSFSHGRTPLHHIFAPIPYHHHHLNSLLSLTYTGCDGDPPSAPSPLIASTASEDFRDATGNVTFTCPPLMATSDGRKDQVVACSETPSEYVFLPAVVLDCDGEFLCAGMEWCSLSSPFLTLFAPSLFSAYVSSLCFSLLHVSFFLPFLPPSLKYMLAKPTHYSQR